MAEKRGSIAFFATYRPPVALDIFSCPQELPQTTSNHQGHEVHMTDGKSYNYNAKVIPPAALKTILKRPELASQRIYKAADVDSGHLSGLIFVSERDNLETLHIALRFNDDTVPKVFSLADVFGTRSFNGVRMEDSGCFAGDYLIYVSTKEPAVRRRQPWTAVYRTNLKTGKTDRLTPLGEADLSPSVSPCGKKIAVASFERKKHQWDGEIEDLKTNIFVMNVEEPFDRNLVIRNGGWPTWGDEDVIFFHRKDEGFWGVYQADISDGLTYSLVTPKGIDAITPAAINDTTVVVATIRKKSKLTDVLLEEAQYRHIEIFDSTQPQKSIHLTRKIRPKADHFNPFVIDIGGNKRIGYHRCKIEHLKMKYDNMFAPVWNQDPQKDTLYVCVGPSFSADKELQICAILDVTSGNQQRIDLTRPSSNGFSCNSAFPSTNREGTKLVYRSTRGDKRYKNLYIMEDAQVGEYGHGKITRLTNGSWTDTHCQWSPTGDWIVFSSTRDKPEDAPKSDNGLDPGYFAIYLVKVNDPSVVVRVTGSGSDLTGHVNHPFFSPDRKSIVVTSDLAGVSVDPISLPLFLHSVRPYGDIFTIDIDPDDINKNWDVKEFNRITHSRYENATGSWTVFSTRDSKAEWNRLLRDKDNPRPCPYAHGDGGESWQTEVNLVIPKRC
ncbi:uncharacterized protein LOC21389580 isoform X2 [Morus notabilis]|uniref:uncharacterized protein LOC21389580 isoform X2 n=1 Tax=Morus notabilis TaxID=981085 RepID=UPI000CED7BA8|nr:uncharacterized protein LOC21389580 isoform X2 [Morus notabilis]